MKNHLAALGLVVALAVSQTGCYGSYSAFHAVHKWNGTIGGKVPRSGVHFLFWILPVYELCLVGDLFIFNTIEFVTGDAVFK